MVLTRSRIVESCFRFGLNGHLFGPLFVLKLGLKVLVWMPFTLGLMFVNFLINNIIDGKKKRIISVTKKKSNG